MSSQQTTGHREEDTSSRYADLPGRGADAGRGTQGSVAPCAPGKDERAMYTETEPARAMGIVLAPRSCWHGEKLRTERQGGRAGKRHHLHVCSGVPQTRSPTGHGSRVRRPGCPLCRHRCPSVTGVHDAVPAGVEKGGGCAAVGRCVRVGVCDGAAAASLLGWTSAVRDGRGDPAVLFVSLHQTLKGRFRLLAAEGLF